MPEGRPVLKVHRYFHKKITNKTDEWNKKRNDNEDSQEDWEAAHMKLIKTVDAEGAVLCHDITQIIRGVTKDAVFRKGHIVTKEDIPVLLSVGKDTLYVWEKEEGMMHEDEAAEVLCEICRGEHMDRSLPKEGKIELTAACDGLLKIDAKALKEVNSFGQMMIATRHGNFAVKKGDKLAGTRIIPLVIEEEKMKKVKAQTMELTGGKRLSMMVHLCIITILASMAEPKI